MGEMIRVNIRVTPEVHTYYKRKSERTGVSMSALMFLELEKTIGPQDYMKEKHIQQERNEAGGRQ